MMDYKKKEKIARKVLFTKYTLEKKEFNTYHGFESAESVRTGLVNQLPKRTKSSQSKFLEAKKESLD